MSELPYDLLRKYLDGETDASENRQLIEWLLEDEGNGRVFADTLSVVSAVRVAGDGRFESRRAAFLDRLKRNLDRQEAEVSRKRRRRIGRFSVIGGVAAALVALSVFLFASGQDHPYHAPQTYASFFNTGNDSDIITLPDGSAVWIMSGSSLRYSAEAINGGTQRTVYLDGEAFFDVAKDTLHPFVVKTPTLSVVAVGTRFNVRNKDGGDVEVMLEEGSVRLRNPQGVNLMRLLPNQTAKLDGKSGDIFIEQRYVQSEIRLKYNVISLTDATMEEIVGNIEKSYGVKIIVGKVPDENKRYNFSCLKSRGADEAMDILSHLTGAECRLGDR